MKAWLDFLPVIAFFIAYKLHGVQTAAAVLIVSVCLVYGLVWLRLRRLERAPLHRRSRQLPRQPQQISSAQPLR